MPAADGSAYVPIAPPRKPKRPRGSSSSSFSPSPVNVENTSYSSRSSSPSYTPTSFSPAPRAVENSLEDQTLPQLLASQTKPVTPSYKPNSFESKFQEFMDAYTVGGAVPVGTENEQSNQSMPDLIKDYEGRLFSRRFNEYIMEQASKKVQGQKADTQEEAAKKFLTGFKDFTSPIKGLDDSAFTSDFGPRVHPVTGGSSFHTGDDLSAPTGTPVRAVANGIVNEANAGDSIYGNQVILRHGNKDQTMYGHMDRFIVEPGQKVKEGQVIGYVGSTGLSTGPHLHLETWKRGQPFDPTGLLQGADPSKTIPGQEYNGPPLTGGGQGDASSGPSVPTMYQQGASTPSQNAAGSNWGTMPNGPTYGMAGPAPVQSSLNNPGGRLGAFLQAISTQESGGDYGAVGTPTSYGTALGKYQVLDSNIEGPGGWDEETIGREITPEQYLNSPKLQEAIAMAKLEEYFKQYGPAGAAKAWYAGPGNAYSNSDSSQYGGPSINDYAASVLAHMRELR